MARTRQTRPTRPARSYENAAKDAETIQEVLTPAGVPIGWYWRPDKPYSLTNGAMTTAIDIDPARAIQEAIALHLGWPLGRVATALDWQMQQGLGDAAD